MSFHDDDGNPTGYSIVLCRYVANAVKAAVGLEEIKLSYSPTAWNWYIASTIGVIGSP